MKTHEEKTYTPAMFTYLNYGVRVRRRMAKRSQAVVAAPLWEGDIVKALLFIHTSEALSQLTDTTKSTAHSVENGQY